MYFKILPIIHKSELHQYHQSSVLVAIAESGGTCFWSILNALEEVEKVFAFYFSTKSISSSSNILTKISI